MLYLIEGKKYYGKPQQYNQTDTNRNQNTGENKNMTYTIKNTARRVIILYNMMEDSINEGSIVGLNMWSKSLLDCIAHIELDNKRLFKNV